MSTKKTYNQKRTTCGSCGNPPMEGKTRCRTCDDKRKARVRNSRLAGECSIDGCHNAPLSGKTKCAKCTQHRSEYDKKIRQQRIAQGLCAQCGQVKNAETKLCASCKKKSLALVTKWNFGGNKPRVLTRDENKCSLCAETERLIVHHVNGDKKDHELDNLITLCRRCHADIHRLGNKETRVIAINLIGYPGINKSVRGRAKMTGWIPTRKLILAQYNNQCILCKADRSLVVHHKDDRGLYAKKPNNKLDNLVVMCRSCHNALTNQRNNSDRSLAARLVIALGPGARGQPASSLQSASSQPASS